MKANLSEKKVTVSNQNEPTLRDRLDMLVAVIAEKNEQLCREIEKSRLLRRRGI